MKICFLAGANSIHSHRWVNYFKNKGHEIFWLSLKESPFQLENINFYKIPDNGKNPLSIFLAARDTKQIIESIKPDILHVHSCGTYGLMGALSCFHPMILTPWGSDLLLAGLAKRYIVKLILSRGDLFTCDGDNTTLTLINFGVPAQTIKRIYFGTDTEKFKPVPNATANEKIIISLRSLEPVYDIETLIKAAAIVLKKIPEARFIIAGDGTQKKKLIILAETLRISESIRFIGFVSGDEIPHILQNSYIYVSTSLSDSGLAASTAEAMACGLPVVASDSGDNKKWIVQGSGGFIVPLKNPQVLAEKIIYLLENQDVRIRFGDYNRKIIKEKNNYHLEMEKMEAVYEYLSFKFKEGRL